MSDAKKTSLPLAFQSHSRAWHDFVYCYPVVSRRSGGLSIGVNLNPDKACNFDCIYCQVDRSTPGRVKKVDLAVVAAELGHLLDRAMDGSLFAEPPLDCVPATNRRVCDIAFSGDGEPTTFPQIAEAVQLAADARTRPGLNETKLVLITDACYLSKPNVRRALSTLDQNNGEIWAKLDAGTQAYYETVNRPNYPLSHVLENIVSAAKVRPIVIQSLWMRVHGQPPPDSEVAAFSDRLNEILSAGGAIKLVQIYTIARKTTESYATPLADAELDALGKAVRKRIPCKVAIYYGVGG